MDANPAGLAQLVEHLSCKQDVVSSILTLGSTERRSLATARRRSFSLTLGNPAGCVHGSLDRPRNLRQLLLFEGSNCRKLGWATAG